MSTTRKIEGEQTPLPPLVSDEELDKWQDQRRGGKGGITFKWNAPKVRDHYEKDRHRTREVVQALVDALAFMPHRLGCDCGSQVCDKVLESLALAKSQLNIEPTK